MPALKKRLLLFDIDGTLIHAGGAGSRALNRAFEKFYRVKNVSSLIRLDGMTDQAIVRTLLEKIKPSPPLSSKKIISNLQIKRILEKYLFFLREEVTTSKTYQVLPGIHKILSHLKKQKDIVLGLATGNLKKGAKIKLNRGQLFDFFRCGGFGCDSEIRREIVAAAIKRAQKKVGPVFAKEEIYVIGDTHHDILSGQELGIKTIAVATGSYSSQSLAKYKPSFLLPNLAQVENFLELISH